MSDYSKEAKHIRLLQVSYQKSSIELLPRIYKHCQGQVTKSADAGAQRLKSKAWNFIDLGYLTRSDRAFCVVHHISSTQ
jgi:hypothetical protein